MATRHVLGARDSVGSRTVFLASLLRDAAARLRFWRSHSSTVATVATTLDATTRPDRPRRKQGLVDRMGAGIAVAPVRQVQIATPPEFNRPVLLAQCADYLPPRF